MSNNITRKKYTEETKKKMSEAHKGHPTSEETRRKIGLAHKGRVLSESHRKKLSESHNGYIMPESQKQKISKALKGKMPKNINAIAGWNKDKKRPQFSGENHPGWKGGKVIQKCLICKKDFKVHPYQKDVTKYCSMVCRNIAMSINNKGDKTNFWQGGISYEPYSIDWTKTLKRSIRERDHYTCKLCGELQSDIAFDIHHIDYDKKNCNPDNLITLCHGCHGKTNHKRGYWINYFSKELGISEIKEEGIIKK